MEVLFGKPAALGYREMPEKMYHKWLNELNNAKYSNQHLVSTLSSRK